MKWCRALLTGLCALALACSQRSEPIPALRHAHLPVGIVAKVGADEIVLDTVQRIAGAEHITLQEARDRALTDALFAAEARAVFDGRGLVPVVERAAWARTLLDGLKSDALARGGASDAEVAELTALRWRELDRPEGVRTTHAVALFGKSVADAKALEVAARVHAAVVGATNSEEFIRLAKAVPSDGVEVRAERLPVVTGDGGVFDPDKPSAEFDQAFDPDFARAAIALAPGQISEPTKTRFGYHVIFCEARFPEKRVALEERRKLLQNEVVKARAERAKQELLNRLGAAQPFAIVRAVDDLTARVQVKE